MKRYNSLPLYRQCIALVVIIEKAMTKTSRQYRFTMGERLVTLALRLPMDFMNGWNEPDAARKTALCIRFVRHLQQLKITLDVAHELGLFYHADFPPILEAVDSIERQINGLLNKNAKVSDTTGVR